MNGQQPIQLLDEGKKEGEVPALDRTSAVTAS
jgi:hypothetical protein